VIKLAVFGSPVSQSRSPAIHRMFAAQCGLKVEYRAIEASADTFASLVRRLADEGGLGCNVTVPLKVQAWELAGRSSPAARRARAANTLRFDSPDDWFADNTDGRGLLRDLTARLGWRPERARIAIIGAGGATAGVLGDLLDRKPACVVIANRTLRRAEQLADIFGTPAQAVPVAGLADCDAFDLVVNATSLGHEGTMPQLSPALFRPESMLYDLNYGPAADPLRHWCSANGIRHADGLGMLVEQAALSFQLWTGKTPACDPVLASLREEIDSPPKG
jgi:shikimate dehydrogenase